MKSIWKNMVFNVVRMVSSVLFPIIIFPYVTRVLGPENLGKVDFGSSVLNYFVLLSGLGIPSYGLIVCAKARNDAEHLKRTVAELLYINVALTAITYVFFFALLCSVNKFRQNMDVLLIYSMNIVFTTIGIEWLYGALEDYGYITIRSLIFKLLSIILIFTFVRGEDDYIRYAAILVISTVGSNVFNFIHARKYIKIYRLGELNLSQHITPILAFFSASVAGTINSNTDTVMLGFLRSDYEVGLYSFSVKIKTILVSLITAALTVTVPRLSQYAEKKEYEKCRDLVSILSTIVLFFACAVAIFFSFFSNDVIVVLGGERYLSAQPTMIVLNLCLIILGVTWILGVAVMQPFGMQQEYAKTMWKATVVNVILNAVLIPSIGSLGAAIATFAAELSNAIYFWKYTKLILQESIRWRNLIFLSFFSLVAAVIAYWCTGLLAISSICRLVLGAVCFFTIYAALSYVFLPEIRAIIRKTLVLIRNYATKYNKQRN